MALIICTVTNDLTYDQRMIRICRSLVKAGHQVTLVGRKRKNSKPVVQDIFQQYRLSCWFDKGKLFYLEFNIKLFLFLLSRPFELLCSVDLDTLLPGVLVSRLKKRKIVYDAHEYFTEVPEVVDRPVVQKIWARVGQYCIPKVDAAYTVGAKLAEIFEERYQKPFGVIRNVPFRQKELAAQRREDKTIILYQGALNEGRGLEQIIEAMQGIKDAELRLAGEGDLSKSLRALTKSLQLTHKVIFLGFLRPEDLKKVTLQAHIGLNLLKNKGKSYYYSLANKAFDYIQAGIPSLQMAFPEYQRINQEHEVFILLPNLKTQTIQTAIKRLLEDGELYEHLQANCLVAREQYVWEEEEKKLLKIYAELI